MISTGASSRNDAGGPVISIDEVLDRVRLSAFQWAVLLICAAGAFVDGANRQGIGLVAHDMMAALHMKATALGIVFAVDNFGAVIGAVIGGRICDRYGRKPVFLVSMAIIAIGTFASAHATGFISLAAVRLFTGFGLGSALPAFLTLASEFAPPRLRGNVAAVIFAGYPVGAAFGGLWSSYLLSHASWQSVFYIGGALPLVVLVAGLWMPEAMQFLLRNGRERQACAIALRIRPDLPREVTLTTGPLDRTAAPAGTLRSLFAPGLAGTTTLLWTVFLLLFATVKVVVTWLPAILTGGGISASSAALVQGIWNAGSVCGQLLALPALKRFGPARVIVPALLLLGVGLCIIGMVASSLPLVLTFTVFAGIGVGIATSGIIATTTTLYASHQRGIGLGAGMASSRFGQVISPVVIALMIDRAVGVQGIMYVIGAMPVIAAIATVPLGRKLSRRTAAGA